MRIAFYAPLKPPDHPQPSGDRRMARELMATLRAAGHEVALASDLRAYERRGRPDDQARIRDAARVEAARLLSAYRAGETPAPELWLTYHVYYKSPDWIGPEIAAALDIPYVVVEASYARKRDRPEWRIAFDGARRALQAADAVLHITAHDRRLLAHIVEADRLHHFPPYLDVAPFAGLDRAGAGEAMAARLGAGEGEARLLTVAMMRDDVKLESYRRLAGALSMIEARPWRLAIVGDGGARDAVEAMFARFGARARFLGLVASDALPEIYGGADLYLWPGVGEAYGMAYLEAAAAGTPVIAQRSRGVPDAAVEGETAVLTPEGLTPTYAAAIARAIEDSAATAALGRRAARFVARERSRAGAAARLQRIFDGSERSR